VEKAMQYAYRDRKTKKRNFRQLWITRINAAARLNGTTYSRLMDGLHKKRVDINRKLLADMAVSNPEAFSEVVKFATA
jgi:large subunit ribosomal protein L20